MIKIKICGLKKLEDVQFAISCGANFIGLVMVPNHHNTVVEKDIHDIFAAIKKSQTKSVAIFQNQDLYTVISMVKKYSFDFVQLHGNESLKYCKEVCKIVPIMKVFALGSKVPIAKTIKQIKSYENCFNYVILDRRIQGSGEMMDVTIAKKIASQFPTFIAGGLTPENVSTVVKKVKPFGVDVSSGVKTKGLVNYGKVKEFIRKVKFI